MTIPLNSSASSQQPFRVPEGYFETLTSRVMAHIPETTSPAAPQRRTLWQIVRPYLSAAAVVAVVALGTKSLQQSVPAAGYQQEVQTQVATAADNLLNDELYSYLMLDDQSLYNYSDEQQ